MPAEARTIVALSAALRSGSTTAAALVEECLAQIEAREPATNAFITVMAERARQEARDADTALAAGGAVGPLHGIPISVKDLFDVRGTTTTAGSRVRQAHTATRDAEAVARLRDAGAIVIGKTNMHEFALGTTNEDSAFGPVRHPLDPNRSPGGSSGGSAASVLANMAVASLGSDTGGSIRIPAAACGLVGLKPAFGEVSTVGTVPLSATLDHVGPLCRSIEDAALLHAVLTGGDGPAPATHDAATSKDIRGMRFGVPREYFLSLLDAQVASSFESACLSLVDAGAILDDVTIPHAGDIAPIYTHIVLSEAASYHAKTLESRPDDYTPNTRLRLEMGRYILAEDYVRALRGRDVLRREVDRALEGRDALLLPSLAVPATRLGATTVKVGGGVEEPVRNITLRLTQLFNLSGHPAIALPCGTTLEGLPISAQLVGQDTRRLLGTAAAVERYLGPGVSC